MIRAFKNSSPRPRRKNRKAHSETAGSALKGPVRSIKIRHCRPHALAAARTLEIIFCQTSASSCAQLTRTQSVPAATSLRARDRSAEASVGKVTMIRTERGPAIGPRTAVAWRLRFSEAASKLRRGGRLGSILRWCRRWRRAWLARHRA
jgi:hypothetical protein